MDFVIEFLASFLIWILLFGLFLLWFTDGKIRREQVLHGLFAFLLSFFVAEVIKVIFPTTRPYQIDGRPVLTIFTDRDGSFPSAHAAAAFALAITIWLHDRKIGILFIIGAFIVGIARVAANVHYPIDIAGGAIIGTIIAYGVEKFHFKF